MENKYVFILDEKGSRITSLLVGVHAESEEACIELAKKEYPDHTYVTGGDDMQAQFISGKCYLDGKFVERQEPELTEEEKQVIETAKTKREYEEERAKLVSALNAAFIDGDEELMKEIREELQELKGSVAKEVSDNVQA